VTLGKTASEYASPPKRTATVAMLSLRVRRVDDLCVSAAVRASSLPSTFSPKTESAAYSSALLLTSIDGGRQRCGSTYKNDECGMTVYVARNVFWTTGARSAPRSAPAR